MSLLFTALLLSCLLLASPCSALRQSSPSSPPTPTPIPTSLSTLPNMRPPPSLRKFNSTSVNALISSYTARMADADLAQLFSNCLPCTLDTTILSHTPRTPKSPPTSFFITGDINAQWLRDSTNQALPYLPLLPHDPPLQDLVCGLVRRQSSDILHDAYANSFNPNASVPAQGHQDDHRMPRMTPLVFEGKWEVDSLAAALKLAYHYYNATQDAACFMEDEVWSSAVKVIIDTLTVQQAPTLPPGVAPYYFQRTTNAPTDSLMLGGVGNVGRYTGMTKTGFRPSDDSALFPFFIAGNAMAVVELRHVGELLQVLAETVSGDVGRAQELRQLGDAATTLAGVLDAGVRRYAVVPVPRWVAVDLGLADGAMMWAYEVDGYGGQTLMDDANVPSLLSLPYLGYTNLSDPLYQTTRAVLLSPHNPYYFNGTAGDGIGGPHVGLDYIWPMSIIMRAMTSSNDSEIVRCLELIKESSAGTGWLHESYHKDRVKDFTRPWFAWVNGLFGQLIMQLAEQRPHLIFKQPQAE